MLSSLACRKTLMVSAGEGKRGRPRLKKRWLGPAVLLAPCLHNRCRIGGAWGAATAH